MERDIPLILTYTYEKIGSTRTVWDGTGTSPVTGPTGPSSDGNAKELTFHYAGTLDATPPADAEVATHYYLIFYTEGTGTDTNGDVYHIHRPTSAQSTPIPLPGTAPITLTEPELSFDHLYWYQDVDHLVVEYEITANDATDITDPITRRLQNERLHSNQPKHSALYPEKDQ